MRGAKKRWLSNACQGATAFPITHQSITENILSPRIGGVVGLLGIEVSRMPQMSARL